MRKYLLLFLVLKSLSLNAVEKIGGEGLPLPPIFSSENKETLVDSNRNLAPSKQTLAVLGAKFKNGDIVFIRSTSVQSKALEEVTESRWTHVGILFYTNKSNTVLLPTSVKGGHWVVYEAGPKVRFNPVEKFVAAKDFAVLRLRDEVNEAQSQQLFKVAQSRIGKPYDIYFLLSRDGGKTKDQPDYCSELVWYVYAKALNIVLGYQVQISSQKLSGPEAQKLIKQRLGKKEAPMSVEEWKKQYVIPPESQILSPLLERIDS